jgi:uncharacterized coiled-coil DUF342 family protein
MSTVDLTVELLKQIRDGVHATNVRLDETRGELSAKLGETNMRLGETNMRLDETNARLDRSRTEFLEVLWTLDGRVDRIDARVGRVEGQLSEALGLVRTLADKDRQLDADVAELRRRVEALEAAAQPRS